MRSTDDPFPTAISTRAPGARRARAHRRRAPSATPRVAPHAPGVCAPEPPSDARGRRDGGDADAHGSFWAVLRSLLAATAGR